MATINVKEELKSQGNIQTVEQVGQYNASKHYNFGALPDNTKRFNHGFTQPSYIIYDYMPVVGGESQMEKNFLITTVVNEFIKARAANTSLAKYDSPDIGKWLIASGGINNLVAEIKRGLKFYYLGKNSKRQMRQAGLQTIPAYMNTYSINGNSSIADYVAEFNRIIQKLSGIKIPKGVPFIDYWFKLSSKVYRENQLDKSANFYFRAVAIPMWDVNGLYGTAGDIVYRNLSTGTADRSPNDLRTMLNLLNTLADVYTTDDTVNNMFAEFEKANMTEVYDLTPITMDELLAGANFEVDLDIIYAVKNATIVPISRNDIINTRIKEGTSNTGGVMLYYSSSLVADHFGVEVSTSVSGKNTLVDIIGNTYCDRIYSCHKDDMNALDNFNALQFATLLKGVSASDIRVQSAGLAILVGMFVGTGNINNDTLYTSYVNANKFIGSGTESVSVIARDVLSSFQVSGMFDLLQFTAIPTLYFLTNSGGTTTPLGDVLIDDSDNSIIINDVVVDKLFDAIVQSAVTYNK